MKVRKLYVAHKRVAYIRHKTMRVAVYCSGAYSSSASATSSDDKGQDGQDVQEREVSFYTQKINNIPGWTLAGIYADFQKNCNNFSPTGITEEAQETQETQQADAGTVTDTAADDVADTGSDRPNFQRMIEDCEAGLIDIIFCKSLSIFATNALDAITNIRKLREMGIQLIFEKEKINTAEAKSEMFISIYAAFAGKDVSLPLSSSSNESYVSKNNNVIYVDGKCAEKNKPMGFIYGYRKTEDGTGYEPVPEEAEVVKTVFNLYEHGMSIPTIVEELFNAGIKPPRYSTTGNERWDKERIYLMLQNEKYAGDVLLQKYYMADSMADSSKRREKLNDGILPAMYIMNHHVPIISRKQFERCNVIIKLKRLGNREWKKEGNIETKIEAKREELSKRQNYGFYPFGDFLRCPYCGHVLFQRRIYVQDWQAYILCEGEGACRGFVIKSAPVRQAVLDAWNSDLTIPILQSLLQAVNTDEPSSLCPQLQQPLSQPSLLIDADGVVNEWCETDREAELRKLVAAKQQYPTFDAVHYWWLDEFVKSIVFGQHSRTSTEVAEFKKLFPDQDIDDRTIQISWKCGLVSVMPSGVVKDRHNPRFRAKLWDAYLLKHPDQLPELTREVEERREADQDNNQDDADSYSDDAENNSENNALEDYCRYLDDIDSNKKKKRNRKRTGRRN